jgi:hypothetical protein
MTRPLDEINGCPGKVEWIGVRSKGGGIRRRQKVIRQRVSASQRVAARVDAPFQGHPRPLRRIQARSHRPPVGIWTPCLCPSRSTRAATDFRDLAHATHRSHIARSGRGVLAPEQHRTTRQPAIDESAEPAICAPPLRLNEREGFWQSRTSIPDRRHSRSCGSPSARACS